MVANPDNTAYEARRAELRRMKRTASMLDSAVALPGGFRVGLDGFIGLIPVVGDGVAAFMSTYLIYRGARLGVATPYLMLMMVNVLVEMVVGMVPVAGDVLDFVWKANEKNMRIIEKHLPEHVPLRGTRQRLTLATAAVALTFLGFVSAVLISAASLIASAVVA